jgi:hypothetical protein
MTLFPITVFWSDLVCVLKFFRKIELSLPIQSNHEKYGHCGIQKTAQFIVKRNVSE